MVRPGDIVVPRMEFGGGRRYAYRRVFDTDGSVVFRARVGCRLLVIAVDARWDRALVLCPNGRVGIVARRFFDTWLAVRGWMPRDVADEWAQ